ncbi:alpha/beta hydrolase [Quadrisphaera setariae]|uniref:Phospholipase n=1 Tax=Quadrisphaera setariae TaxID=2593304 RepID=A0A5C8ZJI6_9ACTN|nr:phospholipase [Quadrisphaera setariae]TXR57291.1 phospholipase [Quadrisphaera setariae]
MVAVDRWGAELSEGRAVVVALHGRGQDRATFRAVVDVLPLDGTAVLAPHIDGDTWYPEPFTADLERNEPALGEALAAVDAAVQEVLDAGVPLERVVLLGFSQGACLALQSFLTAPRRFGAVVALTGGHVGPPGTAPAPPDGVAGVPVLLATHAGDTWVPLWRVQESADLLTAAGAAVTLLVEPGSEHVVTPLAASAVATVLDALPTG